MDWKQLNFKQLDLFWQQSDWKHLYLDWNQSDLDWNYMSLKIRYTYELWRNRQMHTSGYNKIIHEQINKIYNLQKLVAIACMIT